MEPQTTGDKASANGCPSTDSELLPKGYEMVPTVIYWDKDGNKFEGPAKLAFPMVCFLCGKLCDHWPENCPEKDLPESRAFLDKVMATGLRPNVKTDLKAAADTEKTDDKLSELI